MNALELYELLSKYMGEELDDMRIYGFCEECQHVYLMNGSVDDDGDLIFDTIL